MLYKAINRNIFQQCLLKYLPILFIQIFSKILSKCAIAFLHGQLNTAEIFQYQEKNTALNMRHEIDKLFLSIFSVYDTTLIFLKKTKLFHFFSKILFAIQI